MTENTFSNTVTVLSDRHYPHEPTRAQARAVLVETGTADPSERMIDALLDEARDQYKFWKRQEDYEGDCESAEARRTERDYI